MLDINWIIQNIEAYAKMLSARNNSFDLKVLESMHSKHKEAVAHTQKLQQQKNELAEKVGAAKRQKLDVTALLQEADGLKMLLSEAEDRSRALEKELNETLCVLPNIIDQTVPIGKDETANKEVRRHGNPVPKSSGFTLQEHFEIGQSLGMMDFERATKMSGSRFVILYDKLARLERALVNFMLDHNINAGYKECNVPILVNYNAAYGTGQLPKFEEDFFKTTDGRYLISTSEIALTNLASQEILPYKDLPLKFTAATPCFRSEAGAAGRDTKGMFRQHQFTKVELVCVCAPEESLKEHELMTATAESILQKLELPYRTVVLCSGDMGTTASKTYDIEVFMPVSGKYREISSCSNTQSYQARRMMARYKANDGKNAYLHTLNGSALAVGRTIIAIIENYQNSDGTVTIPSTLRPYMNGLDVIGAV